MLSGDEPLELDAGDAVQPYADAGFVGPIPYRSSMPFSAIFPHPLPDGSSVFAAGRGELELRQDYSSLFLSASDGAEGVLVDGEFSRTALAGTIGLGRGVELNVELPFLHYTSGNLDSFIENFHTILRVDQGERDTNPDDQFGVLYVDDGGTFFSAEKDGLHLADIPITLKAGILDPAEDAMGLALRGTLELPTGDDEKGFGSGTWDGGVGVLLEKRLRNLAFYLALDQIFRKNPTFMKDLHVAHVTHGSFAIEYRFSEAFSLVAQTDYQTVPLRDAHLDEFKKYQWSGALGGSFRIAPRSRLRLSIAEGFTTDTAPDFILSAGLTWQF